MSRAKALQYYIVTRLLLAPLMLWTVTTVVFLLLRATPGDPIDAILGTRASDSVRAQMRQDLGLAAPLWLQYVNYITGLLRLDLGSSYAVRGKPVWEIIQAHIPATVELAIYSMAIALVVGIAAGVISASRLNTVWDAGGRLFGIITYALPAFWIGMLLQLFFGVYLGWFPPNSRFPAQSVLPPPVGPTGLYTIDSLLTGNIPAFWVAVHHLALPSLTLGLLISGIFERIVRVNLKQTLKADYIEAARARGISEHRIVFIHALKNALIPVITVMGLTFAALLGGALVTEVTFDWDGLANRLVEAISQRDYPTIQGIVVFFSMIVVLASILVDILNAYIDPRIRY